VFVFMIAQLAHPGGGATARAPGTPPAFQAYERAAASARSGDYDQALLELNEAIRLESGYARAYNLRGYVKSKKGGREWDDFDEAIRLEPDYAEAYFNRGNARYRRWQDAPAQRDALDAVLQDYTQAVRHSERHALAHYNLGSAYEDAGRPDDARKSRATALSIQPLVGAAPDAIPSRREQADRK
jgi:tetratricopeptide (TPR) repeat protein